jgi:hypothetical protein
VDSPLTQADLAKINQALRLLHDLTGIIQRAHASGMDVTGWNDLAQHYQQRLTALKSQFFPGG